MPTRTTLTIDDDVATAVRREVRRSGRTFKAVVNEALRAGLERRTQGPRPFTVAARDLGVRPGIELDDVEGLLERLEQRDRR